MEEIGSNDNVNLVAQATMVPELGDRKFEGMGEVNTRRYFLQKDDDDKKVTSPVLDDMGEQVKLDKAAMEDFFVWGMKKFPAKHYMYVVKKHGLGFAKSGEVVPISAREMKQVLENVEERTGLKPDVLSWDACNMEQIEVQYELKERAQVMTGSPEAIRAVEFPYPTLLHNLTKYAPQQTPETVGQTVVKSYSVDAPRSIQTAIDLRKMDQLGSSMKTLVDTLLSEDVSRDILYTNLMKSASFEPEESLALTYNFRDFAGFIQNLGTDPHIKSEAVHEAAKKAYKALKDSELARHMHPTTKRLKGLSEGAGSSAFLPWRAPSESIRESYRELEWAKDTGWDKLLDHIFEEQPKNLKEEKGSEATLDLGLGKLALYGYKKFVSPYLLSGCPYDPSCSQYSREALENYGIWEGSKMSFMRVVSCQGHGAGGHDPVPHKHGESCEHGHDHHHHHEPVKKPLPDVILHPPEAKEKSGLRKRLEGTLFKVARVTGKLVGGAVAGLVGAPIGAALGAFWGAKAGAGTLDDYNQEVREKYGDHKTDRFQEVQAPLTAAGTKVREVITEKTGSTILGKVAGSVAGTVAGAAIGLVGAGYFGYRFFGGFAGVGLQNLAKDALGELPTHHHTEQILRRDYAA